MTEKLCECGCGQPTRPITENNAFLGLVKGEYRRFLRGHSGRIQPDQEWSSDFWEETDCGYVTPCHVWRRAKDPLGYGRIRRNERTLLAHRFSYEQTHGSIPTGLTLDHLCRNPSCVRPDHLEAVTHKENLRRGANAKLSHEAAAEIRALHKPGTPLHDHALAEQFGVHPRTIYQVLRGKLWDQDPPTSPVGRGY